MTTPKILFVGDSPRVSTGFSRCTRAACLALHQAGYDVTILGINDYGDPDSDFPCRIFPTLNPLDGGRDMFGVTRLPRLVDRIRPDLLIFLNDPWNIRGYFKSIQSYFSDDVEFDIPPSIGWLAVDGLNQQAAPECNALTHVVTWTQFGKMELHHSGYGGPSSVIPLGVDHSTFYPTDKLEARAEILPSNISPDSFIIGCVGRNQIRKRLDLTIEYFAEFIRAGHLTDCYLLLHVAPTGDTGADIKSLTDYYDISKYVLYRSPNIGVGVPDSNLRALYNSMDVLVSTSQGEGWGLQVSEAMACGVPCIVPSWAAFSHTGWTGGPAGAAVTVHCPATALTAPMNGLAYTIGGIPDRATFIEELYAMYRSPLHRQAYRERGLRLAGTLSWERTGQEFVAVVERVLETQRDRQIIEQISSVEVAAP